CRLRLSNVSVGQPTFAGADFLSMRSNDAVKVTLYVPTKPKTSVLQGAPLYCSKGLPQKRFLENPSQEDLQGRPELA
ncbi:MAG: hypothetical protein N2512_05950, partial [Armatimonadetes bacterium]|nr:hypothetical protein [Armatimonadota bacterium]